MIWIHGKASGEVSDIKIDSECFLQIYCIQYDTVDNSGTLELLPGDARTALDGWGTGSANQLAFWDTNNKLKSITGISYESDLDSITLLGTTLYGDYGETNLSRGYYQLLRTTDDYNPFFTFWRSRPVPPNSTAKVLNGDLLGRISAYGHDGNNWSSGSRARIDLSANQDWSTTAHGTRISIQVTPDDSTTPTEVLRIDGNGLHNVYNNLVLVKDYSLEINTNGAANADKLDGQHGSYYTNTNNIYKGTQSITNWMSFLPTTTIRDHFTTSSMSSYWTGWTVTPNQSISYNYWGHWLYAMSSSTQANQICFLYRTGTSYPVNIESQCAADSNNVEVGIMSWQDNNNYIQLFIRGGTGTYNQYDAALFKRSVIGGTITTTQISSPFPGGVIIRFRIYYNGTNCYGYASCSYIPSSYTTSIAIPSNFSPTRWGIFITNLTSTGPRIGYFNWFGTSG